MIERIEMINEKQFARIGYIDVFRSIGIIFMIMGHIGYGSKFDIFIHAFHMPMFFWISGYLFNHKVKEEISFRSFVMKKAKSLLLPYFVFGLAHYLLYLGVKIVTNHNVDVSPLFHLFSINTTGLPICEALWFLTALFFTNILFFFIDRYILNDTMKIIVVAVVAIIGNVANLIFPFTLPFALGASFVGVGLYYLGYFCKKYREQKVIYFITNLSWIPNIILGVITTISIFANGYINMREGIYSTIPLFWINATLSIIVGTNFVRLIYPYIQNNFIGKWLTRIGRDSIVYVCLNNVVILVVNKGLNIVGAQKFVSKILILFITLVLLFIADKIIVNTKLKVLIGKG
ncbi:MAG: acyltransferase family protein [Lachnospiraceae bacterium]